MKDFLDREIHVGDTVVYPGRASSSVWMNVAQVLEVNEVAKTLRVRRTKARCGTVHRDSILASIDRVVVVEPVSHGHELKTGGTRG